MPLHDRNSPRALNDPTIVLTKRRHEHTVVPWKPPDKPQPMLVRTYAGEVTLKSGSDVVRVRKVEVLGHVHLTDHREQLLLLDEVVDLVVERYREHVRTLGRGSVRQ